VAHQAGQGPRRTGVAGESDVGEGHQERGARAADAEIRQKGQRRSGPGGHPPHGGDDRLGQRGQCPYQRIEMFHDRVEGSLCGGEHVGMLLEILPDAEGPAGTGQHHRPAARIVRDGLDRLA
jgi:hypothetical protein